MVNYSLSFYFSLSLKRRDYHITKNYLEKEQINITEKRTVFGEIFFGVITVSKKGRFLCLEL